MQFFANVASATALPQSYIHLGLSKANHFDVSVENPISLAQGFISPIDQKSQVFFNYLRNSRSCEKEIHQMSVDVHVFNLMHVAYHQPRVMALNVQVGTL